MSEATRQAMIPRILGTVYTEEEGPVGAVGNPEGFPSGLLESRSDFKGPGEDLNGQGRRRSSKVSSSLPQGRQPRQLP